MQSLQYDWLSSTVQTFCASLSVQVWDDRIWLMAGNNWGNYSHGIHGTVNEVWSLHLL